MSGHALAASRPRDAVALVVAVVGGMAIAWIDASPGWDDTGITVGSLILAAALAAAVSGRRPWLWALIVGLPTPVVEIARGGDPAVMAALAFAAAGAVVGYLAARAMHRG